LRIDELGEQGLLQRVQRFCPPETIGDDAALLSVEAHQSLVVTTDVLVDQVHFSDRTTSAFDVGWRAAAANLSDLAAMGATPLGITVGLSLPGSVSVAWVEQLYQGLTACLRPYGTPIVGGDLCRSPVVTVAIAAFGQVIPDQAIRRNQAQLGDVIVVSGVHGASRAGLELLLHPEAGQGLAESDRAALIRAHQRPIPRLDLVPTLHSLQASPPFRAIAGMDSSDGLADAILQLCRASGVGALVHRQQIPIPAVFYSWLPPAQALRWALYGGEDFELVLCLPEAMAQELVDQIGESAAIVGMITEGSEVIVQDWDNHGSQEVLSFDQGFQHFG